MSLRRTRDSAVTSARRGPAKSTEFYRFFCHWSCDRRSATEAIAAGSIAGALLVLVELIDAIFSVVGGVHTSSMSAVVLWGMAVCGTWVIIGTWKHVIVAPIVGAATGAYFVIWLVERREVALAVILFIPFVCGFVTAARGIYIMKSILGSRGQPQV
jgi:hypothetical protein